MHLRRDWEDAENVTARPRERDRGRSNARSSGQRHRSRSPKGRPKVDLKDKDQVNAEWRKEHPTRDVWRDLDPKELPDEQLDKFFEGRTKTSPFITYVGGQCGSNATTSTVL